MADRNTAPEPQRQQLGNALEKYGILFSLFCNSYHVRLFWSYSVRYGIFTFLIAYAVMQLLIGIPMFLMEYFIGQFSSSSIISMYSVTPALKGTGIACLFLVMISICATVHESGRELVILAYTFTMPWTHCGNWWNTGHCQMNSTSSELKSSTEVPYLPFSHKKYATPPEEFFKYLVEGLSIGFLWYIMLASIIVWIIVYLLAVSGTRIMGKVALVSTVFRIGTMIVLLLVGLATTLYYGGTHGLKLYFYPQINKLFHYRIWRDTTQLMMLRQLTVTGILTTIGSYDKVQNNCLVDAIIVAVFNLIYPFIYGIAATAFVEFLSEKINQNILDTNSPQESILWALSIVPGNFLWVFLYVLMQFAGKLVFCVIALESVLTSLSDAYPKYFKNRKIVALGVCAPLILLSMIFCIGYYVGYLTWYFVDNYLVYIAPLVYLSWFIFIFVFLYGAGRLVKDIRHFLPGISCAVSWPCYLCWSVIITITYIVKQYDILYGLHFLLRIGIYRYPDWTLELGRFIIFSLPSFIIIYAIIYLIIAKGTFVQRLKSGFRPSVNWGPQESSAKQAWKEYNNKLPLPCGCCHPDCCVDSGAVYDVSIPLRVELTDNPGQPSSSPNDTDPHLPMNIKPGPETTVEDELYPNLTTVP